MRAGRTCLCSTLRPDLDKEPFPFVEQPFAFVGDPVAFVGDPIPSVRVSLTLIGDPVSVVTGHVPFGCDSVTLGRTESGALQDKSATGLGGELAEKGRETSPRHCPDAFGSGELPAPPRRGRAPELIRPPVG
ncbi:hypothetical protein SAMN05421678_10415 [Actinopolymorpha cephalotaxi]|uniref:Uncharacterized protein n=1 Tax=Actinopolymorpha cephalotaxi TaxID=504797 RepID=A0A1I2PCQ5_9ACTN|nr:hypothetical protein SAMN05421678_10415 [Actinopolymorpha cephalotaxi]